MEHSEGHPIRPVYNLKTVVLVLLRLAAFTCGQERDPCPDPDSRLLGDNCYVPIIPTTSIPDDDKKTWESAKKLCSDLGGFVAEPRSEDENQVLHDIKDAKLENLRIWLGGSPSSTPGTWKWNSDGRLMTWTNWGTFNPKDKWHCMGMVRYKWESIECDDKRLVICQKEKEGGKDKTEEENNPESSAPRLAAPSILMSVCVFATAVYMM